MDNYKYKSTFGIEQMSVKFMPLEKRPYVSMPIWKFIKLFKFKAAWYSLRFNWKFRKEIDWGV